MSTDGQGTKSKYHRNVAENFNRSSTVHERYRRQTDRRQTDGRVTANSEREREFTFAKNRPKIGGSVPFFGEGSWVPSWHIVAWTKTNLQANCHLDPCSRLATINMGRKFFEGGSTHFLGRGERGHHLTQSRLGRGLPPYQVAS